MKRLLLGGVAVLTAMGAAAPVASADPYNHRGYVREHRWDRGARHGYRHWRRGERIPHADFYRYPVVNYRHYHLRRPPYGYRYVRDDAGDIVLAAIATGLVVSVIANAH